MHAPPRAAAVTVLAALAIGGAGAQTASAATASGRPAQFTAAPGERNDLSVDDGAGGDAQFSDAGATIVPGLFCVPIPLGQLTCDPDGDPRDTDGGGVRVDLGDGDDRAIVRGVPGTGSRPGAISVLGGAGSDRIENTTSSFVAFDGGSGDDMLITGAGAGATLVGGPGADLMDTTGCCPRASYADHDAAGVRVTLDATANDGAAGEGDDVRTNGVIGSPGPDVIIGDAAANSLTGGAGDDRLDGGRGDDSIVATVEGALAADGSDTVTCGAGSDDVMADASDVAGIDCERIAVGSTAGPELEPGATSARAARDGTVPLTYRVAFLSPGNAVMSRSTVRIVDSRGRAVSSSARFVLGDAAGVARVRLKLKRSTRRRLARSKTGKLALIAQRTSRDATPGSTATGYERFNAALTVRRAARARP